MQPLNVSSSLLGTVVQCVGKTWRYRLCGGDGAVIPDRNKVIFCTWHENILAVSYLFRNTGVGAMASKSKDGRRIAAILSTWGYTIISGSSNHQALSAVRESVRWLQAGKGIIITPDGPQGPRHVVKRGVAHIALLSRSAVIPVHFIARHAVRLRSWDRFIIPCPFTKIEAIFAPPIFHSGKKTDESINGITRQVQETLLSYHT